MAAWNSVYRPVDWVLSWVICSVQGHGCHHGRKVLWGTQRVEAQAAAEVPSGRRTASNKKPIVLNLRNPI